MDNKGGNMKLEYRVQSKREYGGIIVWDNGERTPITHEQYVEMKIWKSDSGLDEGDKKFIKHLRKKSQEKLN